MPDRHWWATEMVQRAAVVQAEPQGQLLPQLYHYWPELFWADIGVQVAGTGAAQALLLVAGGESALGRRRGWAGSLGDRQTLLGLQACPGQDWSSPSFTACSSPVVLLDI